MSKPAGDLRTVREAAAQWHVHFSTGEATPADHAVFEEWRNAHPDHWVEYARIERAWHGVGAAKSLSDLVPKADAPVKRSRAAWVAAAASVCAVVASVAWLIGSGLMPWARNEVYTTRVAETRHISLPDGSTIDLGAKSTVRVDYSHAQRRIGLAGGEAFFVVAKDPRRPFWVSAGNTQVRAVGTQFDVQQGAQQIKVAVIEGVVEVSQGAARSPLVLMAGQQVAALREKIVPVESSHAEWRTGRLVYVNESLREVIADANRYYGSEIVLGTEDIGDLRVTAAFGTRQIDQMIRSLAMAHHLRVDRSAPGQVVLRKDF